MPGLCKTISTKSCHLLRFKWQDEFTLYQHSAPCGGSSMVQTRVPPPRQKPLGSGGLPLGRCLQLMLLAAVFSAPSFALSACGNFGTETPHWFTPLLRARVRAFVWNSPQEQQFSYYTLTPPVLSCVAASWPSPVRIKWTCATREELSPHTLTAVVFPQPLPEVEAGGSRHSLHLCYRATAPHGSPFPLVCPQPCFLALNDFPPFFDEFCGRFQLRYGIV